MDDKIYISFGIRAVRNLNALNGSGSQGNVSDLQRATVLYRNRNGKRRYAQVPITTGNALKHYHTKYFVFEVLKAGREDLISTYDHEFQHRYGKFNDDKFEFLDGKKAKDRGFKEFKNARELEERVIKNLVVGDVHGFLYTESPQVGRPSTIKFSFATPVEEIVREYYSQIASLITHNRVRPIEEKKEGESSTMMLFYKYYASAIYGFRIDFDAYMVSRLYTDPKHRLVEGVNKKERIIRAVDAIRDFIVNPTGASVSRALPIAKPVSIVAIVSKSPIGVVHPYYSDRIEETKNVLKNVEAKVFSYNADVGESVGLHELFERVKEEIEGRMGE